MFSKSRIYGLIVSAMVINIANAYAVSVADASANAANLALNVPVQSATSQAANKGAEA